jgi:hypothetical protein
MADVNYPSHLIARLNRRRLGPGLVLFPLVRSVLDEVNR